MEHIFEAFQNSFQTDEKVIFIANVKDDNKTEGDLMLTQKRLVFYPAKPKSINDILFIKVDLISVIENTEKGIHIYSGEKKGSYEFEFLKGDLIDKLKQLNTNIEVK